jgi:hypothetical protein
MALEDSTNPMQGVSGPGKYSRRTDLSYQSQSYGDGVAYDAAKSGAALATAPKNPMLSQAPQVSAGSAASTPATGLYDPTARPNEPVTHGIDLGPGGGSNVLSMPNPAQNQYETAVNVINRLAASPDASPTLQYLAQRLQSGF